jgi:hypothetical protein
MALGGAYLVDGAVIWVEGVVPAVGACGMEKYSLGAAKTCAQSVIRHGPLFSNVCDTLTSQTIHIVSRVCDEHEHAKFGSNCPGYSSHPCHCII